MTNFEMNIKPVTTKEEQDELDQLLWDVLWKPLSFPRNIRESFNLDKPQIDLIAVDNDIAIGCLMANWLSENEIEIRHVAILPGFQGNSVGTLLVEELFRQIREKAPLTIQTHARSTSIGFFETLGFKPVGERIELTEFMKHGIWIQRMLIKK